MRTPAHTAVLFALASITATATFAQDANTAPPAPAPAASAPATCNPTMKRHDHGAERNVPSAKPMPCAPETAASGTRVRTTSGHDHAKFHKNQ